MALLLYGDRKSTFYGKPKAARNFSPLRLIEIKFLK
jgi:hypothetical protein